MIEVFWPVVSNITDNQVFDWLNDNLGDTEDGLWKLKTHYTISFTRSEDATAFKLRFGL